MEHVSDKVQAKEGDVAQQDEQENFSGFGIEGMENMPDFSEVQGTTEKPPETPDGADVPLLSKASMWIWIGAAIAAAVIVVLVASLLKKKRNPPVQEAAEEPENTEPTKEEEIIPAPTVEPTPQLRGIHAGILHNIGAREDQQDSYGIASESADSDGYMAIVADGMGGLANGKAVSSALVQTFIEGKRSSAYAANPEMMLLDLANRANQRVNQMLRGAKQSGSTLVAAYIRNGRLHFLTVGDSHLYLYRGGALICLNREHAYSEELALGVINGRVPLQQVYSDRQAGALTSYFGIGQIPHLDRSAEGIKLVRGDRILLTSDGVYGTLSCDQMEQALEGPAKEAAQRMGEMIRLRDKPYQDNYTAVILEYYG